jgi:hypothetical protein
MGTRSNIAYEKPNGKVVVMYCHYDGYPEYTYNSVHNFLLDLQGDIEWIYLFTKNEWRVAEVKYIKLPNGNWGKDSLHTNDFTPLWAYFIKNNNAVGDQS